MLGLQRRLPFKGASSWTPPESDLLWGWFDASKGVNFGTSPHVLRWDDQSGNGHNVSQGTATKQPIQVTHNGLTALEFDRTAYQHLLRDYTHVWSDLCFIGLIEYKDDNAYNSPFALLDSGGTWVYTTFVASGGRVLARSYGTPTMSQTTFVSGGWSTNTPLVHYAQNYDDAGTLKGTSNINSVSHDSPANASDPMNTSSRVELGMMNASGYFHGYMYELLIYEGDPGTEALDNILAHLKSKGGIS